MALFRSVPVLINAYRAQASGILTNMRGYQNFNSGDWIIQEADGDRRVMADETFRLLFSPADKEAEAALFATSPPIVDIVVVPRRGARNHEKPLGE